MVNLFLGFSYKTLNIQVYGSQLREAIKTTNLRVVAVTHGDDSQPFFLLPGKSDKKKLKFVAVTHGDKHKCFLVARRNVKRKG